MTTGKEQSVVAASEPSAEGKTGPNRRQFLGSVPIAVAAVGTIGLETVVDASSSAAEASVIP